MLTHLVLNLALAWQQGAPTELERQRERERALRSIEERMRGGSMDAAGRRAAVERQRELLEASDKFVQAWNDFAEEWTKRGTWNVKKHKAVRDAWKRMEKCEGWKQ